MPNIDQYWQSCDWPVVVSAVAPLPYRQGPLAEMRPMATNPVWRPCRRPDFGTRLDCFRHVVRQLRHGNRLSITCKTTDPDWPAIHAWAEGEGHCTERFWE